MSVQMEFGVLPLHKHPQYLQSCCALINREWKRSDTARMRGLQVSCEYLPVSLILLKNHQLIGHLKLSPIPSVKEACFVESVVIQNEERGRGYGKLLMTKAEQYCADKLGLNTIYLSTQGQEGFYTKLGYTACKPISIYGSPQVERAKEKRSTIIIGNIAAPLPPPMPTPLKLGSHKTYMKKQLT